jgi:hypothetical protein
MSLKSRNFVLGDVRFPSEGHPISLIPEIVGDKEVYSILNQNNEHCGYITEDMLNIILKMNEKEDIENNIIRNSLFVDMNDGKEEPTTLAQKIIIDKFKGVTPLNIELYPVKYEENAKPLVMKIEEEYTVKNSGKRLGLNFIEQDTISCDNFIFSNKTPTDVNININSKSDTFKSIHFFNLENSHGKDHEINLYIRNNMMDSLRITNLTFNGLDKDTKGAYHLALEANGSSIAAEKINIKLPAKPQTEGKYCRLSSSKNRNMKIYKSNLTFLEPGSFLEVRKSIDLTGVNLSISGENKVDGSFKFNGDAKNYGTLKIKNLKSYSNLHFSTRNCGIFNLVDSTLNNGNKNIILKRGDTCLDHASIENEGKGDLVLDKVDIRNSKLINISGLHDSKIFNAEIFNFTLKTKNPVANKTIFSFGSFESFCSMKNSVVKLNETDFFKNDTSGALHINNSVIEGTTVIETSGDRGNHSLTIDNSNLKDAQISLNREDDSSKDFTTTISNSEISMFLRANGLKVIRNSIIANGDFNQIDEINDSVCEFVSLDGKDNKILNGYNSVDEKENINMGQAINDLEIL